MTLYTKNIFISHSWAYSDSYNRLIEMLNDAPYFEFRDYSVPKDNPIHNAGSDKELYDAIKVQIQRAGVVIILAGVYASYSKWINKEIEIAKLLNKPIVAVEYWGAEKTSAKVKDNAAKIAKWNSSSIVGAIRECYNDR